MAPTVVIHSLHRTLILRLSLAALVAASLFPRGNVAAQDDLTSEPYVVFVAHQSAHTRCGPGGQYYRTDPLRHGQELEVYVETADGWLGVRPPEDSFCWMPASALEKNADDTATVIEDKSIVWIGTHLGRARKYQWQVQLAKGESVTVIGKSERDGPDGPQLWYRVVPPSGEFRWIHRDQVVESAEELIASIQKIAKVDRPIRESSRERQSDEMETTEIKTASAETSILDKRSLTDELVPRPESPNSGSTRRERSQSRLSIAEEPDLSPAPKPSVPVEQSVPVDHSVIGSGVRPDLSENEINGPVTFQDLPKMELPQVKLPGPVREAVDAAARFVGQPRLMDIGIQNRFAQTETPTSAANAWMPGGSRAPVPPSSSALSGASGLPTSLAAAASVTPSVTQVSGNTNLPTGVSTAGGISPEVQYRYVSPESISRVEDAIAGAGLDQLSLIFSRLMAEAASSEEVAPVLRITRQQINSGDPLNANRARELAQRIERYQSVAQRRDGQTIIQMTAGISQLTPQVPSTGQQVAETQQATETLPRVGTATGFLVQVYSSRVSSPPYALTDSVGNTISYVTPYPGVNLRHHLNSEITVRGNQGYLQGVNTPHVLVTEAVRTQRR